MPGMYIYNSGELRKCERCGAPRRVISSDSWGYWYGVHFCCSYHCMRAMAADDKSRERVRSEIAGVPRPDKPCKKKKDYGAGRGAGYKKFPPEIIDEMLTLRRSGMNCSQIARKLDRSVSTVNKYCRRFGL